MCLSNDIIRQFLLEKGEDLNLKKLMLVFEEKVL